MCSSVKSEKQIPDYRGAGGWRLQRTYEQCPLNQQQCYYRPTEDHERNIVSVIIHELPPYSENFHNT